MQCDGRSRRSTPPSARPSVRSRPGPKNPSARSAGFTVPFVGASALEGRRRLPDATAIDPFDRVQLESVVQVCRRSKSLSAAGRELFAASRAQRSSTNDADRLRKYLARFGLDWAALRAAAAD
ncbi:MAG: Transcriptional regulatory protein RtcR [uncultured Lysobacter sp.]|uniref:Transcriptional regulatory protein RtcR n=1 Tax=uncultured Lysobacter sp. TaxID=271060 RepID=A0A6J4KKB0_9GAMM|nr:MAG: Transcriptional regulatory protein RtcR [uncultured Lysobacter sp.]